MYLAVHVIRCANSICELHRRTRNYPCPVNKVLFNSKKLLFIEFSFASFIARVMVDSNTFILQIFSFTWIFIFSCSNELFFCFQLLWSNYFQNKIRLLICQVHMLQIDSVETNKLNCDVQVNKIEHYHLDRCLFDTTVSSQFASLKRRMGQFVIPSDFCT